MQSGNISVPKSSIFLCYVPFFLDREWLATCVTLLWSPFMLFLWYFPEKDQAHIFQHLLVGQQSFINIFQFSFWHSNLIVWHNSMFQCGVMCYCITRKTPHNNNINWCSCQSCYSLLISLCFLSSLLLQHSQDPSGHEAMGTSSFRIIQYSSLCNHKAHCWAVPQGLALSPNTTSCCL